MRQLAGIPAKVKTLTAITDMTRTNRRHLTVANGASQARPELVAASEPALLREVEGAGGLLRVGDLAKATSKTVRAIHLYESLGLIAPVKRSKGRYRLFAPDSKVRIRWISKLQSLGLSLSEIQEIVQRRGASESARRAAQELREVYVEKLTEVRRQIEQYRSLELELEASVSFLDDCESGCSSEATTGCASCDHYNSHGANAAEFIVGPQLVKSPQS